MTEMRWDVAPGDRPTIPASEQKASSGFLVYTIGLLLAVILTITSFWVANTSVIWAPGVPAGLAVLAIAQMGVHLVFFLHITTGPDSSHNVLALAFGVLIVFLVLAGSLVIMANLNENMMAHTELMNFQMQRNQGDKGSTDSARRNKQLTTQAKPWPRITSTAMEAGGSHATHSAASSGARPRKLALSVAHYRRRRLEPS